MKARYVLMGVVALLFFAGCTPGPNVAIDLADPMREVAGFWLGLWHGFICIFTFIVSLFNDQVQMYEVVNNGPLYNLGFLLGASCALGGGGAASRR
ncbi:MAG: hypothetical protein R2834_12290 [Rhodothermales bacterium]